MTRTAKELQEALDKARAEIRLLTEVDKEETHVIGTGWRWGGGSEHKPIMPMQILIMKLVLVGSIAGSILLTVLGILVDPQILKGLIGTGIVLALLGVVLLSESPHRIEDCEKCSQ